MTTHPVAICIITIGAVVAVYGLLAASIFHIHIGVGIIMVAAFIPPKKKDDSSQQEQEAETQEPRP